MDNQFQNIGGIDFFAESLLHESIRESGTPYRLTANGGVTRTPTLNTANPTVANNDGSDILSVYNQL